MSYRFVLAVSVLAFWGSTSNFCLAESEVGTPKLESAGPLAFAPNGVLLIGDSKSATVFAIETDDTTGNPDQVELSVKSINSKIASLLGVNDSDVLINDVAVNPTSGCAYLSVSRGRGPEALPIVLKVDTNGDLSEFALEAVKFSSIALPNPPEDAERGEGRRRRNSRMESITDLAYLDGKVFIAGLSNEEFASKLRSIKYPFESADEGTSVEIFHGAHGKFETRSPIRTFAAFEIDSDPHLLAAYTCTPLVKFPLSVLSPGKKVQGTTVAELGNHNRPLDMIIYQKDGKDFVLMANSSRGLMKIATEGIADIEGISERIKNTAGLQYDTISDIEGVVQLDRLNYDHALVLIQDKSGAQSLQTIALP